MKQEFEDTPQAMPILFLDIPLSFLPSTII